MNNNNNDNKKYTDEGRQHSEKQKDEICKIRLQFTWKNWTFRKMKAKINKDKKLKF